MSASKETECVGELLYGETLRSGQAVDPYAHILEVAPSLIKVARAKRRKDGVSYRDFYVGASTISVDEAKEKISYFVGANYKPHPEVPKECAEKKALTVARRRRHLFTPGLFVAGTTNRDLIRGVTGLDTPTLHPCEPCRKLNLLQDSTVVVTVGGEEDVFEIHTGQGLDAIYASEESKGRRSRQKTEVHPVVIEDPGFVTFSLAKTLYNERVMGIELESLDSHMLRAQAVVDSIREINLSA